MKYLSLLLLTLLMGACDTAKKNTVVESVPAAETTYVSPTVQTIGEPRLPLSADSIPVEYSIKGIAQAPVAFNQMMGEWVAAYDAQEAVRFLPGKYISYYQGEKVVEEKMTYYQICPDACTGGGEGPQLPCFVLASDYEQMCFAIVNQAEDKLELSLLGSDGAVLTYYRKSNN
jgi:hypothetical protein